MKITGMKLYKLPPRWLFLKIETDEGISGWGEPIIEGSADAVRAAVEEYAKYLMGKDPMRIQDHWQAMYRTNFYRNGAVFMSAMAGIDQALWDIKGKALGVPVYELLGGKTRDKVRVYASVMHTTEDKDELAAQYQQLQQMGFTCLLYTSDAADE